MNIGPTRQLIRRAQPISRERRGGGGGGGEGERVRDISCCIHVFPKKWSFTISNEQSCFLRPHLSDSLSLSLLAFNRILVPNKTNVMTGGNQTKTNKRAGPIRDF